MSSLNKTASWVIIRESTGEVMCETFNPRAVELLKPGFKGVPILEHLQSLNGKTNAEDREQKFGRQIRPIVEREGKCRR